MNLGRKELETFLEGIVAIRALVIGDLMLDEYVWGGAHRISPEAPVPVVDVKCRETRLGGAGNVLNNLMTLKCQVDVAGVIGDDEEGRALLGILQQHGLQKHGVFTCPERVTSCKTRVFASNQQVVRIDREIRSDISAASEEQLIAYLKDALPNLDVIFVSDYQKGVVTEKLVKAVIEIGREANLPVLVDPKGSDYRKYRGATLLTPNRKEAELASGMKMTDEASLLEIGHKLQGELELEALVLTRGEEGMTVFSHNAEFTLPTEAREVYDVSGAGDTVLALFGLAMAQGLTLQSCAWLANLAAGIVVAKVGTSTVSARELLAAVTTAAESEQKIRSARQLQSVLTAERRRGKKVVFTNGCFDLLHVGHVKYLQAARKLGDLLVLGLNSDASITRLKGPSRPLIGEDERSHILAALNCVDYVVIFEEDTPLELISILRPDLLVKGGDYTAEEVVGRELVESYGGRVELITLVDGKSTTGIVEKILRQCREE